jgi:mannan endo-1,4-beta-mannosidase
MLLPAIENSGIAYVLLWRNAGYSAKMKKMHYYVPFKGQVSEADFKLFYANDKTLFQKEVSQFKIYN